MKIRTLVPAVLALAVVGTGCSVPTTNTASSRPSTTTAAAQPSASVAVATPSEAPAASASPSEAGVLPEASATPSEAEPSDAMPSEASASPSESAGAGTPLQTPMPAANEVVRATFDGTTWTGHTADVTLDGTEQLRVTVQCTGATGSEIKYRVEVDGKFGQAGTVGCNSGAISNSVLGEVSGQHKVHLQFSDANGDVTGAYAVIAPEER